MLERIGRFVVRRRWVVLIGTGLFMAAAGFFGGGVAQELSNGGFQDPDSESTLAAQSLQEVFDTGEPNLLLLVTAKAGVDDPSVSRAGLELTSELAREDGLTDVVSYWSLLNAPPLRSSDGLQALVLARIVGDEDEVREVIDVLQPRYDRDVGDITVAVAGSAELFRQVSETVEADLLKAESIAFPITLVLLVLVFGSVVAGLLPLAVGGVAILGTFLVLWVLNQLTLVSIFSLNLTTALGLGLGIDYSLFIVSRFREEMHNGLPPRDAVVRTVQIAGKTVAFSALTVAISLSALLVFPLDFLRSFAYAGVAVVILAGLAAVVFLPALLAVLGPRVDSFRVFRRRQSGTTNGAWHRIAMFVMRRPIPIATVVVAFLLFLGAPFLRIEFGLPDDRVLQPESEIRMITDQIRDNFGSNESTVVSVVADGSGPLGAITPEVDAYAADLSQLEGVARVDAATGSFIAGAKVIGPTPLSNRFVSDDATWLSVVPNIEPVSPEGEALVAAVRDTPAPFDTMVGGSSAGLVDIKESLGSRLLLAGIIIAVVTFVLLFLMVGGVLVPLKAILLNLLSLTATFGATVWVFQDGNLAGFLNFTPTGTIMTTMPILMFCVAFGLSMDYEVFMLSRIKEEYDRTGDNTASVAAGLEKTGRIVTAAALVLAVVLIAFATSGVSFLQMFGLGMALAVLMDASLVRATLVPAFMRLAGRANWWAPAPLRRVYQRFGISEGPAAIEWGQEA
jgi:putative drug exporter of the RND superfamily